jgi:hypothetical protein
MSFIVLPESCKFYIRYIFGEMNERNESLLARKSNYVGPARLANVVQKSRLPEQTRQVEHSFLPFMLKIMTISCKHCFHETSRRRFCLSYRSICPSKDLVLFFGTVLGNVLNSLDQHPILWIDLLKPN